MNDPVTVDLKREMAREVEAERKQQLAWSNTQYYLQHQLKTVDVEEYMENLTEVESNLIMLYVQQYYSHEPFEEVKRRAAECAIGRCILKHIEKSVFSEQEDIVNYD